MPESNHKRTARACGWMLAAMLVAPALNAQERPAEGAEAGPAGALEKDSEVMPAVAGLRERYKSIDNPPRDMRSVVSVGEKLTYLMRWNGVPAGSATLRVKRMLRIKGRDAFNFELHSESNDFLSVFYEVDSTVKSYADARTGWSYLFRRRLHEGRYRANDRLQFDYENRSDDGRLEPISRYSKYEEDKGVKHKTPRPIPGYLQDPLSVLFYLRNFSFQQVGDAYSFLVGTRKETNMVHVSAIGFQTVEIPGVGAFDCVVVEPTGDEVEESDNLFVSTGRAVVYLERHTNIPVMVEVNIPIGQATATLTEIENSPLEEHLVTNAGE